MALVRRLLIVGLLAVLTGAALLLSFAVASSAKPRTCRAEGSTTVLKTSHARVYQIRADAGFLVYGCVYSKNARYLLNPGPTDCEDPIDRPGSPRLAGRYVGYRLAVCNIDQLKESVYVRDLVTGKLLVSTSASPTFRATLTIGTIFVSDLELKANGSVAWIVKRVGNSSDSPPDAEEVRKSDRTIFKEPRTTSKLLDTGDDIELKSLTRDGSTISWTNAGVNKTARLR